MSILLRAALIALVAILLGACSSASSPSSPSDDAIIALPVTPDTTAETVNGTAVPRSLVEAVAEGRGLDLHQPDQRQKALDEVSQYVTLAQAARNLHLHQQPDLAAMIEAARLQGVANATLMAYTRSHPISDAMVAKDYADQVKDVGNKTYRFTQLLFTDKATADKAAAELAAGKPFSAVFDKYRSQARDAHSYPDVFPKQLPPPLAHALTSMETGQATQTPIKSKLGWHLLHVDGINPFQPPPLAKVKDQVRSNMEKKQVAAYIDSLKTQAKITVAPAHTASIQGPTQPGTMRKARGRMVKQGTSAAATSSVTPAAATSTTSPAATSRP